MLSKMRCDFRSLGFWVPRVRHCTRDRLVLLRLSAPKVIRSLEPPGAQQNREAIPLLELYPVTWIYSLCAILEPGPGFSLWLERIFTNQLHTS